MDDNNVKPSLPDISGVFDVDEASIPDEIITPEDNPISQSRDYAPILLSHTKTSSGKASAAGEKAKSGGKGGKKQKNRKKRLILGVCIAAFVLAAVFGIGYAVELSKRPVGEIAVAQTGTISVCYNTKALFYSDIVSTGKVKTVGVFCDNDYDLHAVQVGQSVEISSSDSDIVTGKVLKIEQSPEDSPVLAKIREAFPEGDYSSGVNFIVTVETELVGGAFEHSVGEMSIITARSEDAVTIPAQAVYESNGSAYVWVYKGFSKTVVKAPVTLGLSSNGSVEITEGLKSKAKIVLNFSCDEKLIESSSKIKTAKVTNE